MARRKRFVVSPVAIAAALSFATAVGWTATKFASGSGYWDWWASWWLLALAWGAAVGLVFLTWRPRSAALAASLSVVAAMLGGFATLFLWLIIYGTGD